MMLMTTQFYYWPAHVLSEMDSRRCSYHGDAFCSSWSPEDGEGYVMTAIGDAW